MKYGKIVNERLQYAQKTMQPTLCNVELLLEANLPIRSVLGFKSLNYGIAPEHDEETQYLKEVYSEDDDNIYVDYVIVDYGAGEAE